MFLTFDLRILLLIIHVSLHICISRYYKCLLQDFYINRKVKVKNSINERINCDTFISGNTIQQPEEMPVMCMCINVQIHIKYKSQMVI